MVRLRLKRMGKKKNAFYRIIAIDQKSKRDGRAIEEIGYYDVVKDPAVVKIDKEKAMKWLKDGAQPTDTVRNLLKKEGIIKEFQEAKKNK